MGQELRGIAMADMMLIQSKVPTEAFLDVRESRKGAGPLCWPLTLHISPGPVGEGRQAFTLFCLGSPFSQCHLPLYTVPS